MDTAPLDRADLRVVRALVPHVALAVRAAALTAELDRSRGQVIAASDVSHKVGTVPGGANPQWGLAVGPDGNI